MQDQRDMEERTAVLEEVFRSAPSFLHVLRGPEFIFEFANEAYYQLVGHRELIGRPAFEALPEAAAGGFQQHLRRVMETREPFHGHELQVTLARTPGAPPEVRIIDLVYLPLIDADGTCHRVLGHGTDVTEHVRAREQTEAALRESEARQQAALQREAALRASEAQFQLMAESVPQIVWFADPAGRIEFFNRQWTLYTGVPFQPAPATEIITEFVHPEDAPETIERFESSLRYEETFLVEHRIRSSAGAYRWFLVRGEPFRDPESGQVARWFGTALDIDDRKQAEAAQRKREERQVFLLKLSDRLRPLADPEEIQYEAARTLGEHLGANRVGYAEGQADGETLVVTRNYTHGVPGIEGRYRYADYGPTLLTDLQSGQTVVRGDIAGDATLNDAEKTAHADLQLGATLNVPLVKGGRLVAILFVHYQHAHEWSADEMELLDETAQRVWDAVERARAEAALRESELRYRSLFESIDEGFCVVEVLFDAAGEPVDYRFLEVNPAFEGHTGLVGVQGRLMRELAPEHERYWFDIYGHVARTGEPLRFERPAEALGRFYDVYAFRVGRAEERRVAVLFNDITERKHVTDALAEADRRKDEFLATLAHELRNPLAPIVTAMEVLRLRGDDAAAVERARETIRRQVEHMRRLVDDLLDVARITRGMVVLHLEMVDLGSVLSGAVQMARPLIDRRGQELTVSVPLEPVYLDGDPHRLTQVLTNLLTNAAKFTAKGGRIAVTAERIKGEAVIRVRDSGKGIPADMLPHIFDLFTQVNPSIDRAEGGLGLGLTLVQKLVEMHGGTVEAHSAGSGLGSEFVLRLPARPALPRSGAKTAATAPPPGPRRLRVLAVDDNTDAADTLAELLPIWGHEVRVAYTGLEAVAAAREYRPDVVLLDIGLPGMDGYTVARELRADPVLAGTRLIAVTGFGQDEDRRRAREAGFDEHLAKPVDPEELHRVLDSGHAG